LKTRLSDETRFVYRLGPGDFYPPCSDDPELVLSMETVTAGYKEEINTIEVSAASQVSMLSFFSLFFLRSF
jgi:hypothetical protein